MTSANARKVHFLGDSHGSRTACGRLVVTYKPGNPDHDDDWSRVTCQLCLAAKPQPETKTLAEYADGSGTYRIETRGDTLVTTINDSEVIAQPMLRAPELDGWEYWPDFMHNEVVGTTPDLGDAGAALIDGKAYRLGEPIERPHASYTQPLDGVAFRHVAGYAGHADVPIEVLELLDGGERATIRFLAADRSRGIPKGDVRTVSTFFLL